MMGDNVVIYIYWHKKGLDPWAILWKMVAPLSSRASASSRGGRKNIDPSPSTSEIHNIRWWRRLERKWVGNYNITIQKTGMWNGMIPQSVGIFCLKCPPIRKSIISQEWILSTARIISPKIFIGCRTSALKSTIFSPGLSFSPKTIYASKTIMQKLGGGEFSKPSSWNLKQIAKEEESSSPRILIVPFVILQVEIF